MNTQNIRNIYNQATEQEIKDGLVWYAEAYRTASKLANTFGTDIKRTVWALACLSPNNKWEQNILDLTSVLNAYKNESYIPMMKAYEEGKEKPFFSLACRTYSRQVYKAFEILEGKPSLGKGKKTNAFADNIFFPDSNAVTIDGHALSIYLGRRIAMKDANKLMRKEYDNAMEAYRELAGELNIKPYQLQAITWLVWRRL